MQIEPAAVCSSCHTCNANGGAAGLPDHKMTPACWNCNQLIDKPKEVPPHEDLRFAHQLAPGLKRKIKVYRCDTCGTTLHRYDDAENHPGWVQVPR